MGLGNLANGIKPRKQETCPREQQQKEGSKRL